MVKEPQLYDWVASEPNVIIIFVISFHITIFANASPCNETVCRENRKKEKKMNPAITIIESDGREGWKKSKIKQHTHNGPKIPTREIFELWLITNDRVITNVTHLS